MSQVDMPLATVSILIPCYNASHWIAETLEAVLAQTWPALEVIVADDGSSDDSVEIVRAYQARGVKLLSLANGGAAAARNAAFASSTGAFIQFLDADDLISPDKIEMQMARLSAAPGAVAVCRWGRFTTSVADVRLDPGPTWTDLSPTAWLLANWSRGGGMMFPALWLVPRAVIECAGGWNESLSLNDDGEFFTRVVAASSQVLFCSEPIAYYRSGISGSLSGLRSRAGWVSGFNALESMVGQLLRLDSSESAQATVSRLWQDYAHTCYPWARDLAEQAMSLARRHGKTAIMPGGGRFFRYCSFWLGWRMARVLQEFLRAGKWPRQM